jgi:hypothetical protein
MVVRSGAFEMIYGIEKGAVTERQNKVHRARKGETMKWE